MEGRGVDGKEVFGVLAEFAREGLVLYVEPTASVGVRSVGTRRGVGVAGDVPIE